MRPTAPENFDGDAATDRLDLTWKAQVDLGRLDQPDSQVYLSRYFWTQRIAETFAEPKLRSK